MNLGGAEAAGAPHDDVAVLVAPLEYRSWGQAESLAHLGRNGDLSLCGYFGFGDWHSVTLPG